MFPALVEIKSRPLAVHEEGTPPRKRAPAGEPPSGIVWLDLPLTAGASLLGLAARKLLRGRKGPAAALIRVLGGLLTAAPWMYLWLLRPWHRRWGASEEEVSRPMPGDDLLPHPLAAATRAITIDAPPGAVWPWLVQMGYRRAGWYSYDLLDNSGDPSADWVVPELQRLSVGDTIPAAPEIRLGDIEVYGPEDGRQVMKIEPYRLLVLASMGSGVWRRLEPEFVWTFLLEPVGEDRTRLIERMRSDARPTTLGLLLYPLLDPADFVMARKHLLGIKERAEWAWAHRPGAEDAKRET